MPFKDILSRAQAEGKLVSVYDDASRTSSFSVGYLEQVTDEHIRLESYSKTGRPNGSVTMEIDKIIKLEVDSKYNKKMEKLISLPSWPPFPMKKEPTSKGGDLIKNTLLFAMENRICVQVNIGDDDYMEEGFVTEVGAEVIAMELLDRNGIKESVAYIDLAVIEEVSLNNEPAQIVQYLYESNAKEDAILKSIEDGLKNME